MIQGYASEQATRTWLDRSEVSAYAPLGPTQLMVSRAGFGGYRITTGVGEHARALQHALASGINLIDTSANYADGGSEELVGRVLAHLVEAGELQRRAVVGGASRSRTWCLMERGWSTAFIRRFCRIS